MGRVVRWLFLVSGPMTLLQGSTCDTKQYQPIFDSILGVPTSVSVSGSVNGLHGSIGLSSSFGDAIYLYADGGFQMPGVVQENTSWSVTVLQQPQGQYCSVANGSGVAGSTNITGVQVSCGKGAFDFNVTVDGLVGGTSLQVVDGSDIRRLVNGGNLLGPARAVGTALNITIQDPNGQHCDLPTWPATMPAADLALAIHCSPLSYPVSLSASGLPAGASVDIIATSQAPVHLTSVATTGAWPAPLAFGSSIHAMASAQPASVACRFANGGPIFDSIMPPAPLALPVTCDQAYDLSGTITGLYPDGQLVLSLGAKTYTVTGADATFRFARGLPPGQAWSLAVATQPRNQLCRATPASGSSVAANVGGVAVQCVPFLSFATGQPAALAVGQPNLTSGAPGNAANQLNCPWNNPAIDGNGALFVTSANSNVIFGYTPLPTASNAAASFSIGAATPGAAADGVFFYPAGNSASPAAISAIDNHGVSLWTPPLRSNRPANVQLFDSTCSATGVAVVQDVAFVRQTMLVAQRTTNRVSIWRTVPTSGAQPADAILGQLSPSTCPGGVIDAQHTGQAEGVAANTEVTIVASGDANRLLVWNQPPELLTTGQAADLVLGAANFTTPGTAAATATTYRPTKVLLNGPQMFVTDIANHRVLIWNQRPTSAATPADVVLGQANFTDNQCNRGGGPTAQALCQPHGLAVTRDSLWVTDHVNNRVLKFAAQ